MSLTDPMNALQSFQAAYRKGIISPIRTKADPNVFELRDAAEGEPRLTYARIDKDDRVLAIVNLLETTPYKDETCFGIGYAVDPKYRQNGIATKLVQSAISEMSLLLGKMGVSVFHVEAVIGTENIASIGVAKKTISRTWQSGKDSLSGEQTFQFIGRFQTTTS